MMDNPLTEEEIVEACVTSEVIDCPLSVSALLRCSEGARDAIEAHAATLSCATPGDGGDLPEVRDVAECEPFVRECPGLFPEG